MRKKKLVLKPDKIYHIYNHAISNENLFRSNENYLFFLKKYAHYINPIADTFAYCLLPNHFHFAVRIKEANRLLSYFVSEKKLPASAVLSNPTLIAIDKLISKQFSNFFNSYSKSYNKRYHRRGKLFLDDFERKLIDSHQYFKEIIHYIHFNPVHHKFVTDMRDWKYSSYSSFFTTNASLLKREEVLEWFGNKEKFYEHHQAQINSKRFLNLEF